MSELAMRFDRASLPVGLGKFFMVLGLLFSSLLIAFHGIASFMEGLLFGVALLGLYRPLWLIGGYLFLTTLFQRGFAYHYLDTGVAPIFITEWVMLILFIAGLPHLKATAARYRTAFALVGAYVLVGAAYLIVTLPDWGPLRAMHDFVIIYYSLFAIFVLLFCKSMSDFKLLALCALAGTIPSLVGDMANLLYYTFPSISEQTNHSMRNSFYAIAVASIFIPYLEKTGKLNIPILIYILAVAIVSFFYAYSKTAMLTTLLVYIIYFIPRLRAFGWKLALPLGLLLLMAFMFSSNQKKFQFREIVSPSTFVDNDRMSVSMYAMRDFTEYPYGIGFGSPIFGELSMKWKVSIENDVDIHNSYLTILRRVGIIGFPLFLFMVGFAVLYTLLYYLSGDRDDDKMRAPLSALLGFLSVSIFAAGHVVLEGPFFGAPYWMMLGWLFYNATASRNDGVCLSIESIRRTFNRT